jgi:hypothetical protein
MTVADVSWKLIGVAAGMVSWLTVAILFSG